MHSFFKAQLYNKEICHLELKTKISKQKCIINTDETRLRQIIINLINNAIKFTKKGFIEFGYKDMKNHVLFHVKDTGIGIKKENHQKIFNRFLQASDETEKLYGGTGLGLPIVKAYVNLLGGEIWVESEPDIGSTFFFTISKK